MKHRKTAFDRTGYLLYVVPGARVIRELKHPREAVEAVPDGDIDGLPEYPVPPFAVRDDLRVAAGDVQYDGVHGAGDRASHLDVRDAVVDADERLPPEERQSPGRRRRDLERRAHAGPLGVADAGEVVGGDPRLGERGAEEREEVGEVVMRGLPGQEAVARRGDVGVARVGEDVPGEGDDADADLVGRGLHPQRQQAANLRSRRRRHGGGGGRVLGGDEGRGGEERRGLATSCRVECNL